MSFSSSFGEGTVFNGVIINSRDNFRFKIKNK